MTRNLALSALAGGLMSLAAAVAVAQDASVLDDLYGRGVHAYNSRDSRKAVQLLTDAIDSGSQDARCYYFRGLALRNLGREEDAALDFQVAAKMEQAGPELLDIVSKSLERVQGPARLEIEGYRRIARLKTRNDRIAREKARYEDIAKEDTVVIRKPAGAKPTNPPAALPEATNPDASDPFGGETPEKPETPEPSDDTPPATTDPADEEDAPPAKPKPVKPAADPFGDDPAEEMPEEEVPAKPKPAKPAADPFGDEPADEPPAENEEEPAKAATTDEAATPPAAKPGKAGRSIFGALGKAFMGDSAKPAAAKPAINPADIKDPFADEEAPAAPAKPVKPAPKKPTAPANIEDPFK